MTLQNLIVLGIIPCTNIQLNFQVWLLAVFGLLALWQYRHIIHSKALAAGLLYLTFRKHRAYIDSITI